MATISVKAKARINQWRDFALPYSFNDHTCSTIAIKNSEQFLSDCVSLPKKRTSMSQQQPAGQRPNPRSVHEASSPKITAVQYHELYKTSASATKQNQNQEQKVANSGVINRRTSDPLDVQQSSCPGSMNAFNQYSAQSCFDIRQLELLDIIRQGGNGCARRGEEFNIEVNYERGGYGAMSHRFSTERETSSSAEKSAYNVHENAVEAVQAFA